MIIIIAGKNDTHALKVKNILDSQYNEDTFILDTSTFPASTLLCGSFSNNANGFLLSANGDGCIDLYSAKSLWWRRPQGVSVDPMITNPQVQHFTQTECMSAIYGMLRCCDSLWVNDIGNDDRADYKPYQLKTAARIGFNLPETLITNDPEKVREFRQRHNGQLIYKAFNQRGIIWCPTRLLDDNNLRMLESVKLAPVIFQPLVKGDRDIRVTVIGENIFATEFINNDAASIDYRLQIKPDTCRPHTLPAEMQDKIRQFMRLLGLEYGGIDFRLTPEGEYVFFEINTAGEFMYIQDITHQPIAEAMAHHLARGERAHA